MPSGPSGGEHLRFCSLLGLGCLLQACPDRVASPTLDPQLNVKISEEKKTKKRSHHKDPAIYIADLKQSTDRILLNILVQDILFPLQHLKDVQVARFSPDPNLTDLYKKFDELERKCSL